MMGRQSAPEELFYRFRLEDHVPADHPLRSLDAVLDFDPLRVALKEHYSHTGRPSIDPELMFRMLLFGHMKRHFRFTRLKLRGLSGAAEEFLMMATVQNLRRLIRMRPPDIPTPSRAVPV